LSRNHRVSARDIFLRATSYYQSSEFFLHGNPKDPRIARAYQRSIDCYKRCAKLHEPLIEPVEIPYEKTALPGYFHHVNKAGEPKPTLIMHTGFDGSAEEMHVSGARAAIERGYNVLAFDGPGQYGPLHREGLVFRPDWEKVVTPVVDFALRQPGVDPKRIALMGISMGGYLAPRAAAFEKRLATLIANDGIYDFAAPFRNAVPPEKMGDVRDSLEGGAGAADRCVAGRADEGIANGALVLFARHMDDGCEVAPRIRRQNAGLQLEGRACRSDQLSHAGLRCGK
jgi:pimeloyl-ACP methyl ester carboxylesterase